MRCMIYFIILGTVQSHNFIMTKTVFIVFKMIYDGQLMLFITCI